MSKPKTNNLRPRLVEGKWIMTGAALAPGMYQGTRELNDAKAELIEKLIAKIPEDEYCNGLSNLYCDWTFFSNPPNTPVKDITIWRKSRNLDNSFTDEYMDWHYKCLDYIHRRMQPEPIRINLMSHSGPPFFVKGFEKTLIVYDALRRHDELIDAYLNEDINKLLDNGWIPLASEGRRVDLPKISYCDGRFVPDPKKRVNPVFSHSTWTGEHFGGSIEVDTDITCRDTSITGNLFAGQLRRVMANNIAINALVQVVVACIQSALHEVDCLRITHESDTRKRMGNRYHIAAFDYSSYDTTNPIQLWRPIYERLGKNFFTNRFNEFIVKTHNLPIISPSWDTQSSTPFLYGKLFQHSLNAGVYSGHAGVPIDGKIPGFTNGTYLLHKFTQLPLEVIAENTDKNLFTQLMSDDGMNGFLYEKDRDEYVKFVNNLMKQGKLVFELKWEKYPQFTGSTYLKEGIAYNFMRSVGKAIHTERDKTNKANLALGFEEMLVRQKSNPHYNTIVPELHKFYAKFGHDIFNLGATIPPNKVIAEFMEKPEVIFYKYIKPESYIPQELIDMYFTTIPVKELVIMLDNILDHRYKQGALNNG